MKLFTVKGAIIRVLASALIGVAFALTIISLTGCIDLKSSNPRAQAEAAQREAASTAIVSIPIPKVSYFQERRTIAKWTERWDRPNVPTFVYLFNYGVCIGYYVADGKPASTRSYLMPEETVGGGSGGGYYTLSAPDIDGTYGENNAGIRFFTAEGAAVEWGGSGATYLYSDAILPVNAPKLNPTRP